MMRSIRERLTVAVMVFAACQLWIRGAAPAPQPSTDDCLQCHADSGMAATRHKRPDALGSTVVAGENLSLQVTPESLKGSAHEGLSCTDCHAGIQELPHAEKLPMPSCSCHSDVESEMKEGIHAPSGSASALVPRCADCHGAHQIRPRSDPASSIYPTNIPTTCGACHSNTKGMEALGVRQSNPLENFLTSDHWKSMEGRA
jgi:hypothetical protein